MPLIFACLVVLSCKNDDDVVVLQCATATNVQATDIGIESATIEWNDVNGDIDFTVEYGPSGFVPGNGISVDVSQRMIDITGLEAGSAYDIYIKSVCSVDNESVETAVFSFTTMPPLVSPQYHQNLSELNLFTGPIADLNITPYAFEYKLSTPLFTDYAHKQRIIALPSGEKMIYQGDGFPDFPDNTVIAKTFYYNYDETDLSQGRLIIETRVLIKINGEWELGVYHWNEDQTDAVLNVEAVTLPVTYVDEQGTTNNINYVIPSAPDCFTCHNNAGQETPIGPKLRTMNFDGQLQGFINSGHIEGVLNDDMVSSLPKWDDDSFTMEERARAYFDVNCAHCHVEGGYCENQSTLRLTWETDFNDTNIFTRRNSIRARMQNYIPGWSMPFIGTTFVHTEGFDLINAYLDTLE